MVGNRVCESVWEITVVSDAGGGLNGPKAEAPVQKSRAPASRHNTQRSRFALCLAASILLHAALVVLLPFPLLRGKGPSFGATIDVRFTASTAAPRGAKASEPGPTETMPAESPPRRASGILPRDPPAPAIAAEEPSAEPSAYLDASDSGSGAAAAEITAPPLSSGGLGAPGANPESAFRDAAGTSPEDRAAALLLARVEAALRYPEPARRRGTEGVTGLRIRLDKGGGLADLRIIRSSGSALLDRAARDAVEASLPVANPSGRPFSFELAVRFSLAAKTPSP